MSAPRRIASAQRAVAHRAGPHPLGPQPLDAHRFDAHQLDAQQRDPHQLDPPPFDAQRLDLPDGVEADGCVPSVYEYRGLRCEDRNGFVGALAVRALRQQGRPVPDAMLRMLMRCRVPDAGFAFWPVDAQPAWAPALPTDADDTAIMTLELLHAGRLDRDAARRIACRTIGRHRIATLPVMRPPWLRRGVFATWHRAGRARDLVDCTATANVLALFAAVSLHGIPGAAEATAMLADAVAWAGDRPARAASLSPFYPDPAELVLALAHAVDAGASALRPVHRAAADSAWGRDAETRVLDPDHPVCGSAYATAVWRAPGLARIRAGGVSPQARIA